MPDSAKSIVQEADTSGLNVYFFGPDETENETLTSVYSACNETAQDKWTSFINNTSSGKLASMLYANAMDDAMPCDPDPVETETAFHRLVKVCKGLLVEYITKSASFAPTHHLQAAVVSRVREIVVNFGGGVGAVPTCSPDVNIPTCLRAVWSRQLHLLRNPRSRNGTTWGTQTVWPISASEVNAVFTPLQYEGTSESSFGLVWFGLIWFCLSRLRSAKKRERLTHVAIPGSVCSLGHCTPPLLQCQMANGNASGDTGGSHSSRNRSRDSHQGMVL